MKRFDLRCSVLTLLFAVFGGGCSDPVPELPPPGPSSTSRARLAAELPEGTVEVFGIRMPAKSSIKRETPQSVTLDLPTDVEKSAAYLKEQLVTFKTENRKTQVIFTEAVTKSTPPRRVRITLRSTSMSTEAIVRLVPDPNAAPPAGDPSSRSDDEPPSDN